MFCSNCGSKIQNNTAFCAGCGTKIGEGAVKVQKSATLMPESIMVKDFRCNGCGSPLKIPKNSLKPVRCPSCKTECVIEGLVKNAEMAAKENIASGFPLTSTPAILHSRLLSCLTKSLTMPTDMLEKIEVISEEHHCVPAFYFYCNGSASFTYDAINIREHKTSHDMGDRNVTKWEEYEEATHMSGTANASAEVVTSGNKAFGHHIRNLYMFLNGNKLVDFAELDFPNDVVTHDYNFPQTASFNEYAKPYMEKLLKENAVKSMKNKKTRNLSLGGNRIDKDEVVRIFLGLYRIIFKYNNKEYSIWVTGDGEKAISDEIPIDTERQKELNEKVNAKEQALGSIPKQKTGLLTFGMIVSILLIPFSFLLLISSPYVMSPIFNFVPIVLLLLSIGGTITFTILRNIKYNLQKTAHNEIEVKHQKEIDEFNSKIRNVIQQFKSKKQALRGIYAKVTGDAKAFDDSDDDDYDLDDDDFDDDD
ncbi:MAG: zinc-ribbon domain-containing protein [Treponema sp.]|nr:zinc-ribbon domain-containing protein [Treponema sp.]